MTGHADTEELTDEVRETITHHNRLYQRFSVDRKIYFVPVDEDETIRLRIQHDVLTMVFDGRSIFPPMGSLRRVLDCGFGTGLWAFQVAWENPRCEACIVWFLGAATLHGSQLPENDFPRRVSSDPYVFERKQFYLRLRNGWPGLFWLYGALARCWSQKTGEASQL
ncbi:hypothetical protein F5Y05DRAFT_217879 [Hypoxylon sp. FL0543]|nr:hypothetical protein F5Y05DRAFT_217879 [Hypoxylon sp. FL0543]